MSNFPFVSSIQHSLMQTPLADDNSTIADFVNDFKHLRMLIYIKHSESEYNATFKYYFL